MKGLFLTAAVLVLSSPSLAIECNQRQAVVDYLARNFNERVVAVGAADNGDLIERTESPSGSWTLLITRRVNDVTLSCVFTSGSDWQKLTPGKGA